MTSQIFFPRFILFHFILNKAPQCVQTVPECVRIKSFQGVFAPIRKSKHILTQHDNDYTPIPPAYGTIIFASDALFFRPNHIYDPGFLFQSR